MQQDYYATVTSLIASSAANNPEARRRVYELARYELRRRLASRAKEFGQFDEAKHLQAFEIAIERIEADLSKYPVEGECCGANLVTAAVDSSVESYHLRGMDRCRLSHGPLSHQSVPVRGRLLFGRYYHL
jgi:hypothetical protein